MKQATIHWLAVTPAVVVLASVAACATPVASVPIGVQSTGSSSFSLSGPQAYRVNGGIKFVGTACRLAQSTLLTPLRVRLDHVAATGAIVQSAEAFLPSIGRQTDQRCSHYITTLDWRVGDGETVRACFDRGHACPGGPP